MRTHWSADPLDSTAEEADPARRFTGPGAGAITKKGGTST